VPRRAIPHPGALRLGTRVRDLRRQRGVSISRLADACEQSKGHLSTFERGLVNVTVGTLFKIAQALETTPMHIMCAAGDSDLERSVEELHALSSTARRKLAAKLSRTVRPPAFDEPASGPDCPSTPEPIVPHARRPGAPPCGDGE